MGNTIPVHWVEYVVLLLSVITHTNTTINLVTTSENLQDPVITRLRMMWRNVRIGSAVCTVLIGMLLAVSGHGTGGVVSIAIGTGGGLFWRGFFHRIETYHPKGFTDDLRSWISSICGWRRPNK